MAKTKIEVDLQLKDGDSVGQVEGKVVSLKTQLRNLKAELASGNLTGKEFDAAAKRAGELQDRIQDVSQRVKNLASDSQKLDGFVSLTQGIVGGFAAVQGITALVGDENEDLQKTMVKLQAAMSALAGIQAVANTLNKDSAALTALTTIKTTAQTAATTLLTFATGGATVAANAFRVALLATGIGAVVVLLIAVANKMDLFGDSVATTTEKLKAQKEAQDALNEKFKEGDNQLISRYQQERDIAKARLKLQGASNEEILKQDRIFLLKKKALLELEVGDNTLDPEKRKAAQLEVNKIENELLLQSLEQKQAIKDEAAKKAEQKAKAQGDDVKKKSPDTQKAIDDEIEKEQEIERLRVKYDEDLLDQQKRTAEEEKRLRDIADAQKLEDARIVAETKKQIEADTYSFINNLGEIFVGQQYKQSAIGKTLALTQIAIDTARAISSLVAASEANPTNAVTYGGAGAAQFIAGLARITANILQAKNVLNSGGSASSSGGGTGGGYSSTPPPIKGYIPQQNTDKNNPDTKVYVLEKDITDKQGRVARIRANAELH